MNQRRAKLVMVGISLMVGLALFEGVLRIAGVGFPVFVQVDRVTGVAHVPGARGWFAREGRGWVEINDLGLRGPACRETKRQGTLRIALLGDSFTEAFQVDDQVSFARVVERRLGETLHTPVEVLNFGVRGVGAAQGYLVLKPHP